MPIPLASCPGFRASGFGCSCPLTCENLGRSPRCCGFRLFLSKGDALGTHSSAGCMHCGHEGHLVTQMYVHFAGAGAPCLSDGKSTKHWRPWGATGALRKRLHSRNPRRGNEAADSQDSVQPPDAFILQQRRHSSRHALCVHLAIHPYICVSISIARHALCVYLAIHPNTYVSISMAISM